MMQEKGVNMSRLFKTKLLIEVETSFDDELSDEDTVAFCVEQDLEEMGWQINNIEIYKEEER